MAAQRKTRATGRRATSKEAVIHLPDTKELAASKMSQSEIEKLVEDIAGEKGRLKSVRGRQGIPTVAVKSGVRVARSFTTDTQNIPTNPNGWIKTIWRRAC